MAFIYYAALLHDIGASNTYLVKEHCEIGRDILLKLPMRNTIANYVYYHHEYFNGTGPFKLKGYEIPLPAQIICIADLFDKRFGTIMELNLDAINQIIDRRSPFTYEHSMGIANLVNKITIKLGYDYKIQNKMHVVALLHDIGKLAISNDIIDKVGKLSEEERVQINNIPITQDGY